MTNPTATPAAAKAPAPRRARKAPTAAGTELTGVEAGVAQAADRDASVLNGVRAAAGTETKAPAPRRARKSPAASAPAKTTGTKTRDESANQAATRKAGTKVEPTNDAPAPAADANGSARSQTREWARRVATALAAEFSGDSDEAKVKVAYWIHGLPFGGADGSNAGGAKRWFPEGLPRPTTADWR